MQDMVRDAPVEGNFPTTACHTSPSARSTQLRSMLPPHIGWRAIGLPRSYSLPPLRCPEFCIRAYDSVSTTSPTHGGSK
jgi:hypothetical protein